MFYRVSLVVIFKGDGIRSQVALGSIPLYTAATTAIVTETACIELRHCLAANHYQQTQHDEKMPHPNSLKIV
jgi:hypothetical protein